MYQSSRKVSPGKRYFLSYKINMLSRGLMQRSEWLAGLYGPWGLEFPEKRDISPRFWILLSIGLSSDEMCSMPVTEKKSFIYSTSRMAGRDAHGNHWRQKCGLQGRCPTQYKIHIYGDCDIVKCGEARCRRTSKQEQTTRDSCASVSKKDADDNNTPLEVYLLISVSRLLVWLCDVELPWLCNAVD